MSAQATMTAAPETLKEQVREALEDVKDPEIRALSVVELGIIVDIQANEQGEVAVVMTPTFSGCPALNIMQEQVKTRAGKVPGVTSAEVQVNYDVQWNTNMISDKGRQKARTVAARTPPCKVRSALPCAAPFTTAGTVRKPSSNLSRWAKLQVD
jgi:ring-1,2-phenylacetyl-CoA epoxidase subunit PaaD